MRSDKAKAAIRDLMIANRILGAEGVVDAYGHISVRNPDNPERYFLSQSRSPELVSEDDVMEYDLDSNPIDQQGRPMYSERPIHGALYQARPDVMSVCHSHAYALVPFTVTDTPIKPIWTMSGAIGTEVPIWHEDQYAGDRQQEGALPRTQAGLAHLLHDARAWRCDSNKGSAADGPRLRVPDAQRHHADAGDVDR